MRQSNRHLAGVIGGAARRPHPGVSQAKTYPRKLWITMWMKCHGRVLVTENMENFTE
jgi:hypothetical protein